MLFILSSSYTSIQYSLLALIIALPGCSGVYTMGIYRYIHIPPFIQIVWAITFGIGMLMMKYLQSYVIEQLLIVLLPRCSTSDGMLFCHRILFSRIELTLYILLLVVL